MNPEYEVYCHRNTAYAESELAESHYHATLSHLARAMVAQVGAIAALEDIDAHPDEIAKEHTTWQYLADYGAALQNVFEVFNEEVDRPTLQGYLCADLEGDE